MGPEPVRGGQWIGGYPVGMTLDFLKKVEGIVLEIAKTIQEDGITVPDKLPQGCSAYEKPTGPGPGIIGLEKKGRYWYWKELRPATDVFDHWPFGLYPPDPVTRDGMKEKQELVLKRYLQIVHNATHPNGERWTLPTNAGIYGEDKQLSPRQFLEFVAYNFGPYDPTPIFRWSTDVSAEVELLKSSLESAREEANESLAEGGSMDEEARRVLKVWLTEFKGQPLQHLEVALIRWGSKQSIPRQEHWTSNFLYRFAKKTGKAGSRAPWALRQGTLSRPY